ncbi:hypothetical protein [Turicibacter sanguinis]|uniref:hypothetical protein n=1 Tax=Turicibacter sanguinis TaxID=154288 RepID=UPI00325BDAF8
MKKLKKYLSLGVVVLVSLCTKLEVSAATMDEIDSNLLSRGYPKLVIDSLDNDSKSRIYEDSDLEFIGASILYYNEDNQEFNELEIQKDGRIIGDMTKGQISTNDLSLIWNYSASYLSNPKRLNYIDVTYSYNWKKLPLFRWQDPIAVSWDGSKFKIKSNSFKKTDYYDTSTITGKIHSYESGYASGSTNGVTWYADLKGHVIANPIRLYGNANFKLEPTSTTTSGSTTIYGHYVHPTASGSASIGIKDYGSFSVNVGGGYDERGNQTTVKY